MNKAIKRSLIAFLMLLIVFGNATHVFAVDEKNTTPTTEEVEQIPVPDNGTPADSESTETQTSTEADRIPTEIENQENLTNKSIKKPIETPKSVTGERYDGSGTVVDFTTTGSKAFYTIKAQDNSIYYLIIDLDKTENNVYFLSEINGEQLTLSEITAKNTTPTTTETQIPAPQSESSGNGDLLFYGAIGLVGIGFVAYYYFFKIKKGSFKKKETKTNQETETESDLDVYDDDLIDDEDEYIEDNEE